MDIIKHVAPLCYLCFYLFTSPLVTSENVDHHLLSVQWPNSYCSVPFTSKTAGRKIPKCRRRIPQEFTIHGLWPQGSNSQRLRDCVNNSLPAGLSRTKKVLDKVCVCEPIYIYIGVGITVLASFYNNIHRLSRFFLFFFYTVFTYVTLNASVFCFCSLRNFKMYYIKSGLVSIKTTWRFGLISGNPTVHAVV